MEASEGAASGADPAVFENNALHPYYFDEGTTAVLTAAAVNALVDMTVSGNIDGPCAQSSDWHLLPGSACIDRGTATAAPLLDMDGQLRDATPDIGPDEYVQ